MLLPENRVLGINKLEGPRGGLAANDFLTRLERVAFVSLKDSIDLTTASGKLLLHLVAAMAEFERTLIQERVRSGLQNAKRRGKRLGRPPAIVDAARVARLRANGASLRGIASQVGVSVATVH